MGASNKDILREFITIGVIYIDNLNYPTYFADLSIIIKEFFMADNNRNEPSNENRNRNENRQPSNPKRDENRKDREGSSNEKNRTSSSSC